MYRHPNTVYTVDFPPGPLAIGNDDVTSWETVRRGDYLLHVLSPTDCVRDRLAWYIMPQPDLTSLTQAVAVARDLDIDLDAIRAWCERERESDKFETFAKFLAQERARK
jgi:hypothetical protein